MNIPPALAERLFPTAPGRVRKVFTRPVTSGPGATLSRFYQAQEDARLAVVNHRLGMLRTMLDEGAPAADLRAWLDACWFHHHRELYAHAGGDSGLRAIFAAAGLAPGPDWPPVIRLWRGVKGIGLAEAQAGRSWTRLRDGALAFTMHDELPPLLIAADVPKRCVVADLGPETVCVGVTGAWIDEAPRTAPAR